MKLKDVQEALKLVEQADPDLLAGLTVYDRHMQAMSKAVGTLAKRWKPGKDGHRSDLWERYFADLEDEERSELTNPLLVHEAAAPRLVLLIDDLDRCLPPKAFALLEAVRFHLAVAGVLVVMAVDDRVLGRYVEQHYGLEDGGDAARAEPLLTGREFLDKVFQWSYELRFAAFDAVREVYFCGVRLGGAGLGLLEGLRVPYRTWVRIRNRIAGRVAAGAPVPDADLWLGVLVELVPDADHWLRRNPSAWAEIRDGTPGEEQIRLLAGMADKELARTLEDAYRALREAGEM